jgi:hypothetical protein
MLPAPDEYSCEVGPMPDDLDRVKKLIDTLTDESKEEVKRYLNGTRAYNKGYDEIAKKVEAHIIKQGHITNKEAYDRGYTTSLLDTTTFTRCIVSKLTIEVGKKKLHNPSKSGRNRIAFYDIRRGAPSDFSKIDSELIEDILSKVDFRRKRNDLLPIVNNGKYPALRKKAGLVELRPHLKKAMAKRGYELIGSRLEFVKGE